MKRILLAVGCILGLACLAHAQEILSARGADLLKLVFEGPLVDLTLGPCDPIPAPLAAKAVGGCEDPAFSKDLVLYYPFDEDLGPIVRDASWGGRTGLVNGATWVKEGVRGGAYRFDNNQQSITATDAGLPSGNSPRTMAVWIKLDHLYPDGTTGLFSYGTWQWNRACGLGMDWRNDRDQFYFTQNGGVALSRAKMEQPGVWRHLAYVYDGTGRHRLYVDGVASDGMSELRGPINTTLSGLLMLAGHPGSIGPDGGYLDEAMIFNRALSPAEVGAVHRGALPVEIVESAAGDCPRVITRIWMAKEALGGIRPPEPIPVKFVETSAGDCPRVITRVWTATDRCGNTASAKQTITMVDQTPPVLVGVPADIEVECGAVPPPAAVTARDDGNCGSSSIPGLVLRYSFDPDSRLVARDSSGQGNDGRLVDAHLVPGFEGNGAAFDGSQSFIRTPSRESLMPEEITLSTWVWMDSLPTETAPLVFKRNNGYHDNEGYSLQVAPSGAARLALGNGSWQRLLDSEAPLGLGRWHHVAATFSRPAMKVYVDGRLAATAAYDLPLQHNRSADLFIGSRDHLSHPMGPFAACLLDEVRIYKRALSAEEVGAVYRGTTPAETVKVEMTETSKGDCPRVITRVWTAKDRCGNTASAKQTITVVDQAPPMLIGVPADVEVACGAVPPPAEVTARDEGNCGPASIPGLVLYYPFDEDLGAIVRDASRNGRTATVNGATWVKDGAHGGAYRFDNKNQAITATDAGLPSGDAPRSLAAWMRIDTNYANGITWMLYYGTAGFNRNICLLGFDWRLDRDRVMFSPGGVCFLSERKVPAPGTWVHVAYTYGGNGTHHLYINGLLNDGMSELRGPVNTLLPGLLSMGGHPESVGPDGGYLDEVMMFDRELSAEEVGAVYRGTPPVEPIKVEMVETRVGDCPGVITRVWTATDRCGNAASATQTITIAAAVTPATRHVWQDSPAPGYPFDTWENAAHTIQEAVDAAIPGETVLVTNGVYETGTRVTPGHRTPNRVVITNDITVRSVNGPEETVIRGQGPRGSNAVRCVYILHGRLIGFTLANGHTRTDGDGSFDQAGGGLNAHPSIGVVVSNCVLTGNSAYASGGATSCTFYNCLFRGNTAVRSGGGVSSATLYNCAILDNVATTYGGGADQCEVYNCTIAGNSALNGGGAFNCRLYNSIVYGNSPANVDWVTCSYSCVAPLQAGEGNIADDPKLLSDGHIAADSPCVGKGSAAYAFGTDIDGDAWLKPPSMGCDEPVAAPAILNVQPRSVGTISYASSMDCLYTLQRCEDLSSGVWVDVPGQTRIPGSGGIDALSDPESSKACFYRIIVESP